MHFKHITWNVNNDVQFVDLPAFSLVMSLSLSLTFFLISLFPGFNLQV